MAPAVLVAFSTFAEERHPVPRLLLSWSFEFRPAVLDFFDSAKSLIHHAREDLRELQSLCDKAVSGDCYTYITDRDPKTGQKRIKIKFMVTAVTSRASYDANNILNNCRHSLDQGLVAAITSLTGNRPTENVYFPFATCPNDLDGRLKSSVIPGSLHSFLHSRQPYPRGPNHAGGNDFLCAVTKAVGPNKHQVTIGALPNMLPSMTFAGAIFSGGILHAEVPAHWDMENQEAVLAIVTDDFETSLNPQVAFQIVFSDAGPMTGYPVVSVLDKFAAEAEGIVGALEAETRRISAYSAPMARSYVRRSLRWIWGDLCVEGAPWSWVESWQAAVNSDLGRGNSYVSALSPHYSR